MSLEYIIILHVMNDWLSTVYTMLGALNICFNNLNKSVRGNADRPPVVPIVILTVTVFDQIAEYVIMTCIMYCECIRNL